MTRNTKITIGILVILLIISLCFTTHYYRALEKTSVDTTVVVSERTDTIRDTVPQLKIEKEVGVSTDRFTQYKIVHDTINDSTYVEVEVPITQKTYSDDSTYTAYVSGYKQKLDSIDVYKKTITIDRTITITKKDVKRWSIGPVIYGGYDIQNRSFGYGVGIGVSYGLFRW